MIYLLISYLLYKNICRQKIMSEISQAHNKYPDPLQSINHSKQLGNCTSKMTSNTIEGRIQFENIHKDGEQNSLQNNQDLYFQEQINKNKKSQHSKQKKHPSTFANHSEMQKHENQTTEKAQEKTGDSLAAHGKYSNKIQNFHLQQASKIRPSIFQGDYNENFSLAKPLQIKSHKEDQYNPTNIKNRNHHLKSGDVRYQQAIPSFKKEEPIIEANVQASIEKKRTRKLPSISSKSNHFLSLQQSSNIILNSIQGMNNSHQIHGHLRQHKKTIFTPINSVQHFDFTREKKFGRNYYYPSYSIQKQGVTLVTARKQACGFNSTYLIKSGEQMNAVAGYLKGNFSGTEFNLYENNLERNIQQLVCTIIYDISCGCGSSFRRSEVYINNSKNNAMFQGETKRKNLKTLYEQGYTAQICKLKTKEPKWSENQKCYTLSFGGRGKVASIKNMILVSQQNQQSKKFLFCKISEDKFYIEAKNPLNLFIIMGILMSSFDFKLLCQ